VPRQFLSAEAIAPLYDAHPETFRRLYRAGRIPGYKVGRYLRFDPDEVADALRSTPGRAAVAATPDFDALDAA
jgi:excisionase family DNA binding protein